MKKIISILLLSLYLLSVEGLSVSRHFCAGVIAGIEYFDKYDEQDCCGVEECNDCCYDETVTIKIKEEHLSNKSFWVKKWTASDVVLPLIETFYSQPRLSELVNICSVIYKPEKGDLTARLLYIDYCSWLI